MPPWSWSSSPHPISDVRDWSQARRLILRPSYQRKEVWSLSAKILLMDTILSNIPMPKFYVQSEIRAGDTYRSVIDGQQRIGAILSFLNDEFKLNSPYRGSHSGLIFSELPIPIQNEFLSYELNFNEIRNASEDVVREIYARVNRYNVSLNKQELRRADYPGHFLKVSEKLAQRNLLDEFGVFTIANRRRMQDVEYVSELLITLIDGPQDKKQSLDQFYGDLMVWNKGARHEIIQRLDIILSEIYLIFSQTEKFINKTRFRQKADFYALFLAISELLDDGGSLAEKDLQFLAEDLDLLDRSIEPASDTKLFSEYAIKCTSQANTLASRKWRKDFLKSFLSGTYLSVYPLNETIEAFISIIKDGEDPMCPPQEHECPHCKEELNIFQDVTLDWDVETSVYQLANARIIHKACGADHNNPAN